MSLTIIPAGQIFGKYKHQARIAELNRKTAVKTIQTQADRVTISSEARKAQVLGIARAVREASKNLDTGSKSSDEIKPNLDTDIEPSSPSEDIVHKALEQSSKLNE